MTMLQRHRDHLLDTDLLAALPGEPAAREPLRSALLDELTHATAERHANLASHRRRQA
jgi:hypothetical protein